MRLSEELRQRTKRFSSKSIRLYVSLPRDRYEIQVLAKQLLSTATFVAAHAREASRVKIDSEFCSKLDVFLQEADESMLCLSI